MARGKKNTRSASTFQASVDTFQTNDSMTAFVAGKREVTANDPEQRNFSKSGGFVSPQSLDDLTPETRGGMLLEIAHSLANSVANPVAGSGNSASTASAILASVQNYLTVAVPQARAARVAALRAELEAQTADALA